MARSRRGRGEGSIYQRSDGTWCATFSSGYDTNGRRKRRTVFAPTKEAVKNKLTKVQHSKLEGSWSEPTKLRISGFLKRWLEDAARPTIRLTTYTSYEGIIRLHINPRIGGVNLARLNPAQVQGLYADMERDGHGPRVRQLTHAVLRRALKQALKWGLVPRNVCDAVDPPRVARRTMVPLTPAQVLMLLKESEQDRLGAVYALAIGSGMRLGEIFGLQWHNVDLEAQAITVCHTLQEVKGMLELTEPKTSKSRRRVDIPKVAVEVIRKHQASMLAEGFGDVPWVFCNSTGGPLRKTHFHRNDFKPLLKRAKLPNIRFHDLRHTSATMLLSAGVHPKVVQERLGHSQIAITLDTYSHVMPSLQVEAAGKLDAMMG